MGKRVGSYIQELRQQQGFSVRQLGEQIGLSYGYISMIEHGQREVSISALYPIVRVLQGDFSHAICLLVADAGVPEDALPPKLCRMG